MPAVSINPATGEEIHRYDEMNSAEIDRVLERSEKAYRRYRHTPFPERARRLQTAARFLEEEARPLAEIITREMGKPIRQAEAEVRKCARVCRFYAEEGEAFLRHEPVVTEARTSYVAFQPLGPILAVMPWNFPFWQVFRIVAPALAAGNTVLLKHASNVTGCSLAIENVLLQAGFEAGEMQSLIAGSEEVAPILADRRVRAATLTGSEGAGRAVGAGAGKHLKPSVLELGGSDPFIVLADADLDRAAATAVTSRMQNNGQSCIAAKRFIVEGAVYDPFLERFIERTASLKVGDPMHDDTDIGPLGSAGGRNDLHEQIRRSVAAGAEARMGGMALDRPGFFYLPTVLVGVQQGMAAFDEEVFGPAAAVIRARDRAEAIQLANASSFGLGAAVFTENREEGERVALELEAGCVFVNEMVKSDPRLPFGGIKNSGYGRELSHFGIREFVNVKSVWID